MKILYCLLVLKYWSINTENDDFTKQLNVVVKKRGTEPCLPYFPLKHVIMYSVSHTQMENVAWDENMGFALRTWTVRIGRGTRQWTSTLESPWIKTNTYSSLTSTCPTKNQAHWNPIVSPAPVINTARKEIRWVAHRLEEQDNSHCYSNFRVSKKCTLPHSLREGKWMNWHQNSQWTMC